MRGSEAKKLAQEMANKGLIEVVSGIHAWHVCSKAHYAHPAQPINMQGMRAHSSKDEVLAFAQSTGANYLFISEGKYVPYIVINTSSLERLATAGPINDDLFPVIQKQLEGKSQLMLGENKVRYTNISADEYECEKQKWFSEALKIARPCIKFTISQEYELRRRDSKYVSLWSRSHWGSDKKTIKKALKACGSSKKMISPESYYGYTYLFKSKQPFDKMVSSYVRALEQYEDVTQCGIVIHDANLTHEEMLKAPWPAYKIELIKTSLGTYASLDHNLVELYAQDKEYFKKHFIAAQSDKKKQVIQALIRNNVSFDTDTENWLSEEYPELCQEVGIGLLS